MVSRNLHQAHLQEMGLTQILVDHDFFNILFQHDKCEDILQGKFQIPRQIPESTTPPSNSLKWIEFETYYIIPNPSFFFRQQNMLWSCNMVHSHFTLCLRACDYIKWLPQHPWHSLWMRVKGPHHYKLTVKWP
jgi:hypothetical protein